MGVLYKKLVVFLPFFAERGEGVWAESKKSLSEKTELIKKGGGVSVF